MKVYGACRNRNSEAGTAILIAIFILLLIGVVGISLVVASGTESSLASNYRSSTKVYYASMAGLEEGRGRLMPQDPHYFNTFVASSGSTLPLGQVRYVLNPISGETVAPTNLSSATTYPDTEYATEFGTPITSATVQTTTSASSVAGLPGALYKWVRINAISEKSINVDVNKDTILDTTTPLFYDGSTLNLTSAGAQALEITSLGVLPNGSQKLLHYIVAPAAPIQVDAAIHTQLDVYMGDALNVTGYTDPVCAMPPTYGVKSGKTVTIPGGGNVTGSPAAAVSNAPFVYNIPALVAALKPSSVPIDTSGTGVTGAGTPISYSGPHAILGVAPTVTYNASGAIITMTNPGSPVTYYSNGNLTLGTPVIGGTAPSGQGVLIVNGNLKVDITNGFNYFGLILVSGDVTFTANPNPATAGNVHGTIIATGIFGSTSLVNLGGSIFVTQNACLVQNAIQGIPLAVLSFRELNQ